MHGSGHLRETVEETHFDAIVGKMQRHLVEVRSLVIAPAHLECIRILPRSRRGDLRGMARIHVRANHFGPLGRRAGQFGLTVAPTANAAVDRVEFAAGIEAETATAAIERDRQPAHAERVRFDRKVAMRDRLRRGGRAFGQCQSQSREPRTQVIGCGAIDGLRCLTQAGQQMFPDEIDHSLHVERAARDRDDRVERRDDDAELAECAVAAKRIVAAAPELVGIALVPVTVLFELSEILPRSGRRLDLEARRLLDPLARQQLLAIPAALLQIELAEFRDRVGRRAKPPAAGVDAARTFRPTHRWKS